MHGVGAMKQRQNSRSSVSERTSQRIFFGVSALLCVCSAALTIHWCASMSMRAMPMPGGWTMSMTWMRMPDQTWFGAAASFVGMWVTMMVAMMLPSLTPILWRYYQIMRQNTGKTMTLTAGQVVRQPNGLATEQAREAHRVRLTLMVGMGYFLVWTLIGMAAYPIGVALATIEMQSLALAHVVPIAAAIVVLMAGALQFTAWKANLLVCCREAPSCYLLTSNVCFAWRYGLRLGFQCSCCCAGMTAILFVSGIMDLRTMAIITAAITAERLLPAGEQVARIIGVVVVAVGLLMIARSVAWV